MNRWLAGLATGMLLLLVGCNTFEGLGKDITKAGEAIESASKKK
jgi:predicted small secreted protein